MKQLNFYNKHQLNKPKDVFDYLVDTILFNNRTWEYFINWDKVFNNVNQYKIELNILNSLCGSKDFNNELKHILKNYPEVIKVFPTLLGVRDKKIDVLDSSVLPDFKFKGNYVFSILKKGRIREERLNRESEWNIHSVKVVFC